MKANDERNGLTAGRLRELLRYDPTSGAFEWAVDRGGRARRGDKAGRIGSDGYLRIKIDGRDYFAQRLAWLWLHGVWPTSFIDHRDGNRANNRESNLRDVSLQCNMQNIRRAHADSVSGLLGASWHAARNSWRAQIRVNGKSRRLGDFATAQEASDAYIEAKRRLHEGSLV